MPDRVPRPVSIVLARACCRSFPATSRPSRRSRRRLGDRGSARRVLAGSVPFVAGFTFVFVAARGGRGGARRHRGQARPEKIAGFVLVVIGLAFVACCRCRNALSRPACSSGARDSGSRVLLGGAFAVCAAPCVGPILVSALVLARRHSSTVAQGALLLLAAYSLGLAVASCSPASCSCPRWDRSAGCATASTIRDRERRDRLVALGLLLFFDRVWWLRF